MKRVKWLFFCVIFLLMIWHSAQIWKTNYFFASFGTDFSLPYWARLQVKTLYQDMSYKYPKTRYIKFKCDSLDQNKLIYDLQMVDSSLDTMLNTSVTGIIIDLYDYQSSRNSQTWGNSMSQDLVSWWPKKLNPNQYKSYSRAFYYFNEETSVSYTLVFDECNCYFFSDFR